jgi:hypothetical protein
MLANKTAKAQQVYLYTPMIMMRKKIDFVTPNNFRGEA